MCETCRAIPKEHRAKAGYDLRLVPAVECLFCKDPIGSEEYVEIDVLARFGSMSFAHRRCDEKANARDRRSKISAESVSGKPAVSKTATARSIRASAADRRKTDQWVRRLNQLGRAMDKRAETRAVTDATREAITRKARGRWKRLAARGPRA